MKKIISFLEKTKISQVLKTFSVKHLKRFKKYQTRKTKLIALGAFGFTICLYLFWGIPAPWNLSSASFPISTKIYDRNDKLLYEIYVDRNRTPIKISDLPDHVKWATISAEDKDFYHHHGFSITGIGRASYNIIFHQKLQGGSTITQQYAKNAFLTQERSITRKIKELVIAIKLENQLTKDQILENYLNTIYFGRGSYGIETASQQYFNRSASQLSLAQSAVIASVLRSPGYYDPQYGKENMSRLKARFQYVLDGMVKSGWITKSQEKAAKFPTIMPGTSEGWLSGPKGYLIEMVRSELIKRGFTDDQLMKGGLVIKTTFDQKAQTAAIGAVAALTPAKSPENLHIGLVAIRPGTGEIIALYGGRDYVKRQLNDATQSIALAGSTFKPFALAAALESGIPLTSMWNGDTPQTFDDAGKPYIVNNYGGEGWGQIDLMTATAHSVNTVYVPLGIKAGPDKVVDVARRAGIPDSVAMMPTPSVVLGAASPHVIDVAVAYATFAAQGVYAAPWFITEVNGSNGGVLYQAASPSPNTVFSKDVMADLTYGLQEVVKNGTATYGTAGLGRPAAGKTGTSEQNASAWFSGYTPQLAASVAMFRDDATQTLNGIGGLNSVTGGTFPAKIWTAFMKGALSGEPVLSFPKPVHIGGTDPV
ncbi:MAG: penicillin-binding protein, partial [Patescibacteria group bacterium]|nr:penicillin-binding protein [Patescibacteria group bacterium]